MTEIDLALVNGRIRTLDPDRPSATALAIADGVLAAVGDDAEIRRLCGAGTEVIDLDGATRRVTGGRRSGPMSIATGARCGSSASAGFSA
jgi:hypothetical protein